MLALADPPRPDTKPAIDRMRKASVRVFMVTGDFRLTAISIAKSVGIITSSSVDSLQMMQENAELRARFKGLSPPAMKPHSLAETRSLVLEGSELSTMSKEDWDCAIGGYTEIVFARTTPEQKLRIVEEIKARGDNTVGVTGDGVNDAPALKAATVGVAMGSGSDVAKEAASLVLLNNDFASIPVAIENGRLLFDNLKKVICYLMPAGTYAEFSAIFLNAFLGQPLSLSGYQQIIMCVSICRSRISAPKHACDFLRRRSTKTSQTNRGALEPSQITNDIAMALSIMYEKPESDLMSRPPRNARTDRLTDWRYFVHVYAFIGPMMIFFANLMWFLYMGQQGIGINELLLAFGNWTDGYLGFSIDQLTYFQSVGQTIFYVSLCMFNVSARLM